MAQMGYRRIKIKMSQQVIDMAIPQAMAMVNGGIAEYVEEENPARTPLEEAKSAAVGAGQKVETAAVNVKNAETSAKPGKPANRQVSR